MTKSVVVAIPKKYRNRLDEELSLVNEVYGSIHDIVFISKPNYKHYIPVPKIDELKKRKDSWDTLVILDLLKPRQIVELYRLFRKEIVDRLELILKIFALHAGSKEAKLQIELARIRHELPLIREAIRYMKLGELHGYLGGGRYAIDKYYRVAKSRMARIRRELDELRRIREIRRHSRKKLGFPHISIVGYTCAGKTTLFNRLVNESKPEGPEPFTTLSPKAGSVSYNGSKYIFIDTVGFIRDIPHEIIEAFYATLEEIIYSDLVVNVIDASKNINDVLNEIHESKRILTNIGVHGKPVVIALNKIDLVNDKIVILMDKIAENFNDYYTEIIPISAKKSINIDKLLSKISSLLNDNIEK